MAFLCSTVPGRSVERGWKSGIGDEGEVGSIRRLGWGSVVSADMVSISEAVAELRTVWTYSSLEKRNVPLKFIAIIQVRAFALTLLVLMADILSSRSKLDISKAA